jgi:hypothetical protein
MVRNRRIPVKNATELMLECTAFSFKDPKKAAEMFAEDGAFELPYLATFGLPTQYTGRDAIAGFFQSVLDIYPSFQFANTKVLIDMGLNGFLNFIPLPPPGGIAGQFMGTRAHAESGNRRSSAVSAGEVCPVEHEVRPRGSKKHQKSIRTTSPTMRNRKKSVLLINFSAAC